MIVERLTLGILMSLEQTSLEKQYGKVNINIQTGEISYPEDEQANKED